MDPEPYDALAVELSSYQLHWSHSLSPHAAAVLNVAPDHLSWHGDLAATPPARADLPRRRSRASTTWRTRGPARWSRRRRSSRAAGRSASPWASRRGHARSRGRRAGRPGFRRGARAQRGRAGPGLRRPTAAPHNVANALAAAALARAHGVAGELGTAALQVPAGPAPRRDGRPLSRGWVRRRLQGHEPPCRAGVIGGLRPRRVARRGLAKGADFDDSCAAAGSAARRRAVRGGPRPDRGASRDTPPRCR